jgi:hypothetical protein
MAEGDYSIKLLCEIAKVSKSVIINGLNVKFSLLQNR